MENMWVKVDAAVAFGNRTAIATISPRQLLNLKSMDIRLFADIPEFNEDFVRILLNERYGNTANWQLHVVMYRIETNSLDVVVSSPDFEVVEDGQCSPRI